MVTILMGLGLVVASGVIIYPFIPAKGMARNRSWSAQWGDIVVASGVSAFISGLVTTVVGAAGF